VRGQWATAGRRPAQSPRLLVVGWLATSGRPLAAARNLIDCELAPPFSFCNFGVYFIYFLCYEDGPGILEEWVYNISIF
jgi:hypothetical protein